MLFLFFIGTTLAISYIQQIQVRLDFQTQHPFDNLILNSIDKASFNISHDCTHIDGDENHLFECGSKQFYIHQSQLLQKGQILVQQSKFINRIFSVQEQQIITSNRWREKITQTYLILESKIIGNLLSTLFIDLESSFIKLNFKYLNKKSINYTLCTQIEQQIRMNQIQFDKLTNIVIVVRNHKFMLHIHLTWIQISQFLIKNLDFQTNKQCDLIGIHAFINSKIVNLVVVCAEQIIQFQIDLSTDSFLDIINSNSIQTNSLLNNLNNTIGMQGLGTLLILRFQSKQLLFNLLQFDLIKEFGELNILLSPLTNNIGNLNALIYYKSSQIQVYGVYQIEGQIRVEYIQDLNQDFPTSSYTDGHRMFLLLPGNRIYIICIPGTKMVLQVKRKTMIPVDCLECKNFVKVSNIESYESFINKTPLNSLECRNNCTLTVLRAQMDEKKQYNSSSYAQCQQEYQRFYQQNAKKNLDFIIPYQQINLIENQYSLAQMEKNTTTQQDQNIMTNNKSDYLFYEYLFVILSIILVDLLYIGPKFLIKLIFGAEQLYLDKFQIDRFQQIKQFLVEQGAIKYQLYQKKTLLFDQRVCPLCLEEYQSDETIIQLFCGHAQHQICFEKWINLIKNIQKCAICNQEYLIQLIQYQSISEYLYKCYQQSLL